MEVFLSSKAIKGVFDSTVVQKTKDIKKILIRQQCEISLKTSYNVILKMTIHLEITPIFHTYYAWKVSYNFEVGEFSETTQKLETRSVRLHANNIFGHNALLFFCS